MTTEKNNDIKASDQKWMDAQLLEVTFGRTLNAHRLCQEWTQQDVANKLGISKQMYSAYENDQKLPSPKKAYEIAEALGILPEMLVLKVINAQLKRDNLGIQVSIAS